MIKQASLIQRQILYCVMNIGAISGISAMDIRIYNILLPISNDKG